MALSQLLVISSRGDTLLRRNMRGENAGGSAEEFYSEVTERGEGTLPVFKRSGVLYYYVIRSGLYFVATTEFDMPPSFVFELINRIIMNLKAFCGFLSEESLKRNFALAYELLDEMLDFGYVQCTNVSQLKQKVSNAPVVPKTPTRISNPLRAPGLSNPKIMPSSGSQRPLTGGSPLPSEIFVDVVEKIVATLGPKDTCKTMTIEGQIHIKSFLRGQPPVRIALNEGLVINSRRTKISNAPVLNHCSFHHSVDTSDFEKQRVLAVTPSEGEFTLMSYRISGSATLPFRVNPSVEISSDTANLTINLYSVMPQHLVANVKVVCQLPVFARDVHTNTASNHPGQSAEYKNKERTLNWNIKHFAGCTGLTLKGTVKMEPQKSKVSQREFGPINVLFEAPMYSASNVQVRYLRIMQAQGASPTYRWVRYITSSSSYLYRF